MSHTWTKSAPKTPPQPRYVSRLRNIAVVDRQLSRCWPAQNNPARTAAGL